MRIVAGGPPEVYLTVNCSLTGRKAGHFDLQIRANVEPLAGNIPAWGNMS